MPELHFGNLLFFLSTRADDVMAMASIVDVVDGMNDDDADAAADADAP